jgi:uncharacterized protein
MMKNQVSLLVLMCFMVSLTRPVWSVSKDPNEDLHEESFLTSTLMGMPKEVRQRIISLVTAPEDLGSLLLLNKSTYHLVKESPEKRMAFLKVMVTRGDRDSQCELAKIYLWEKDRQDWDKAIPLLQLAGEQGHPEAQYCLSWFYRYGSGKEKKEPDWDNFFFWGTKSAEQGLADAQFLLADAFIEGHGNQLKNNEVNKAIPWLIKAADQGHLRAQYMLAFFYEIGEGTSKNIWKAIDYYTLAAEQGHVDSQYDLAELLKKGDGNFKTPEWPQAMYWYTKAVEKGHLRALDELANAYAQGFGNKEGKPEWDKAMPLFASLAHLGDMMAQYQLGRGYHYGKGVPQDFAKACRWYGLAAEQGYIDALNALERISDRPRIN